MEFHQKLLKTKVDELQRFMDDIKHRRRIRDDVYIQLDRPLMPENPIEKANDKSLKMKMKFWIYLHNLNKPKVDEYLRKYRESKVDEFELHLEALEDADRNVALMDYKQCLNTTNEVPLVATSEKGGSEFARQTAERDKIQYDNMVEYIDHINVLGFWRTK